VGVALVAGKNREHGCAQDIAVGGGIGAGERQRAALYPGVQQAADLQKLSEERQLPERSDRRMRVPLNVHPPAEGIDRDRAGSRHRRGGFSLTFRVTALIADIRLLAVGFQPVRSPGERLNCSI
jgi:hypothetical protein